VNEVSLSQALEVCTEKCKEMNAPLSERLALFADTIREMAPELTAIVDRMVARLQAASAGSSAPGVGDEMPPFVLPDTDGHLVALTELLKTSDTVIAFHRGHWCPYCRISASALAEVEEEVRAAGAQLIVITPELQRFNQQLKEEAKAEFPILTDLDCGYALDLNIAVKINDEKRLAMIGAGYDIAPYQDNGNWILPIPATFVIGQNGRIKARYIDPDYRKRMEIDDLLKALRPAGSNSRPA
jgi:peroxiredoxin